MTPAIAIFVKTPGLSPVKTRLAAAIGTEAAERLYRLSAASVAAAVRATAWPWYWAVAEDDEGAASAWPGAPVVSQGDGDLGARMQRVYDVLLARHGAAVLIGADVPQVTASILSATVAPLSDPQSPWVLGPAADGGFWLVGGRAPIPITAWRNTPWSRADTAAHFCAALSPQPALGALLRDVDDLEALAALADTLETMTDPTPEQTRLRSALTTVLARQVAARRA